MIYIKRRKRRNGGLFIKMITNRKSDERILHRKPYAAFLLVGLMFILTISMVSAITDVTFEKDTEKIS
jgi:hypothetical protein